MVQKKLEKNLRKEEKVKKAITIEKKESVQKYGVSGKLRTLYNSFLIMKRLGKGCFGSLGTHYGYLHYFSWEK
jgi:hypothetical protein